jgi:hypothetical protein
VKVAYWPETGELRNDNAPEAICVKGFARIAFYFLVIPSLNFLSLSNPVIFCFLIIDDKTIGP